MSALVLMANGVIYAANGSDFLNEPHAYICVDGNMASIPKRPYTGLTEIKQSVLVYLRNDGGEALNS